MDDASKGHFIIDVKLPAGVEAVLFRLPGAWASLFRVFTVPGIYRYVCTLHEANGMKGVVIVRPIANAGSGQMFWKNRVLFGGP